VQVPYAAFPHPDFNDTMGIKASINARVGKSHSPVSVSRTEGIRSFVWQWLRSNLEPCQIDEDLSFETWLLNTNYNDQRRQQLREAHLTMLQDGLPPDDRKVTRVNCFIKDESYPSYKHYRSILARSDYFKTYVGPWFKVIERALFVKEYFIKKIPVADRPKYMEDYFGEIVGSEVDNDSDRDRIINTDYTSFEGSFLPEFMKAVEMQLYVYMVGHLPGGLEFIRVIKKVLLGTNRLYFKSDDHLMFEVLARRMSGEMNTSLGNSFSNLMIYLYNLHLMGKRGKCLVEGDDLIGTYCGPKIPEHYYSELGFTVKIIYLRTVNLASFCGQIYDKETFTVIADPTKVMLNFGWCGFRYKDSKLKKRMELIRAKALSMLATYPGCPILYVMALCYVRLTNQYHYMLDASLSWYEKAIKSSQIKEALTGKYDNYEISLSSRLLMEEVYGYSIAEQESLERYFVSLKEICPLWHPVLLAHVSKVHLDYARDYVTADIGGGFFLPTCQGAITKVLI
jgi:hypothetical protein